MENNDPMVQLLADEGLVKTDGNAYFGRKGMIERLLKAAKVVSEKGYRLHIYQIYRSPETQTNRRNELYEQLKQKYPDYDETEILRLLNTGIAGVGGGHQTGGAVDMGLCDKEGRELDMGTQYSEHNQKTKTRCIALTDEQRRNRRVLVDAMQRAGFVNYPAEWWHFSYGDKMWAAYSSKKSALYDIVRC
jgi:D-alanyl-D-alanine dipeptidase